MSEYDDLGDWSAELSRLAGSVQPTPETGPLVLNRIRRRQRRRAVVAVLASAAVVAAVAGTGFALSRPSADQPGPAAPMIGTTPVADLFSCPTGMDWIEEMRDNPSPIPDLVHQRDVIAALDAGHWKAFTIRFRAPSLLGVVAFVEGDLDAASTLLGSESVPIVYAWQPWMHPGDGLVDQAMQWQLDPAVAWARRQFDGGVGYAGIAIDTGTGQVLLQWKSPVPDEISRLARIMPNGVEIVVTPVRYSESDVARGADQAARASRAGDIDGEWTSTFGCADGSGLVVGIKPPLADRRARLQEQLEKVTGMPVMVIPQDFVTALTARPSP